MKYILNKEAFKKGLIERGYRGVADFAVQNRIHRNTLQKLLTGRPVFSMTFQLLVDILKVDPLALMTPVSEIKGIPHGEELRPVIGPLIRQDKKIAVVLIGSRASGKAKYYSDWDLGIVRYPEPITGIEYLQFKNKVEEMTDNLVRSVDLVNLNQAPAWFLEGLSSIIFLDGNRETYI